MLQILTRRDGDRLPAGQNTTNIRTRNDGDRAAIDVRPEKRFRLGVLGWSFVVCVAAPVIVSALYLSLIASDEYTSDAKFTIRTASENKSSAINDAVSNISATMGMGLGAGSTSQEVFFVSEYIRGRSIIADIGGEALMHEVYSRPDIDWLSRLLANSTREDTWKYWKRKVSAIIDTPSGVITLEVRAFHRDDALKLANLILEKSEALVNEISERSRNDALARAKSEMSLAEGRLQRARIALLAFRNRGQLIDPTMSAKSLSETIAKLEQDRLIMESTLASLLTGAGPDSPSVRVLNVQIETTKNQIEALKNQLTSQKQSSAISEQISGYENVQLEVQFAEKLYSITQASYETARAEQEKQQLYLVTVEKPGLAEVATYPNVVLDSFTILAACFILWSMVILMAATVRDHIGD